MIQQRRRTRGSDWPTAKEAPSWEAARMLTASGRRVRIGVAPFTHTPPIRAVAARIDLQNARRYGGA